MNWSSKDTLEIVSEFGRGLHKLSRLNSTPSVAVGSRFFTRRKRDAEPHFIILHSAACTTIKLLHCRFQTSRSHQNFVSPFVTIQKSLRSIEVSSKTHWNQLDLSQPCRLSSPLVNTSQPPTFRCQDAIRLLSTTSSIDRATSSIFTSTTSRTSTHLTFFYTREETQKRLSRISNHDVWRGLVVLVGGHYQCRQLVFAGLFHHHV